MIQILWEKHCKRKYVHIYIGGEMESSTETYGLPWEFRWERICPQCRRLVFHPWVRKMLYRREWQPTPIFLPRESLGQRSLVGYSPWDCKELDTSEQLTLSLSHTNIIIIFSWRLRFGVISIFFFMFFYIFQNVLKCIQFKIKFCFMCFFKIAIVMASIYLKLTMYWNYLSYLLLLTNWILKTVLWNRDPPYPHLQLGMIILPKRHREKVTCPSVHSYVMAEFGFKFWTSGPEFTFWIVTLESRGLQIVDNGQIWSTLCFYK